MNRPRKGNHMTIQEYISRLRQNPEFMDNVTSWQVMPARPAWYGDFPEALDGRIVETLNRVRGLRSETEEKRERH